MRYAFALGIFAPVYDDGHRDDEDPAPIPFVDRYAAVGIR